MTIKNELPCIEGGSPVRSAFLSFVPPSIREEEINEVRYIKVWLDYHRTKG